MDYVVDRHDEVHLQLLNLLLILSEYVLYAVVLHDSFYDLSMDAVNIEHDIFSCHLLCLIVFQLIFAKVFETYRNNVVDGFCQKMFDLIFDILIEMAFQEILTVIDFLFGEVEAKAKLVLEDGIPGIEQVFEVHAVVQGVPILEVGDEKGGWVVGGRTGLILGGELPCFGEVVRF